MIFILDNTEGAQEKEREKFENFVNYVMEKAVQV